MPDLLHWSAFLGATFILLLIFDQSQEAPLPPNVRLGFGSASMNVSIYERGD
jgi:hypothetical protein